MGQVLSVSALSNEGTINLAGGAAQAALDVNFMPAPAILLGTYYLAGKAVLDYANGAITAIGPGAILSLDGSAAEVDSGTATGNSALKTLAMNNGMLSLADGATLATTVVLANATPYNFSSSNQGVINVDLTGSGGSTLTVGGPLTNGAGADINIGNSAITATATAFAGPLGNIGNINLIGGAAQAVLWSGGLVPSTLTGLYHLTGRALLHFGGTHAGITTIASSASLLLDGDGSYLPQVNNFNGPGNSALKNAAMLGICRSATACRCRSPAISATAGPSTSATAGPSTSATAAFRETRW